MLRFVLVQTLSSLPAMALVKVLFLSQFLTIGKTLNIKFFPCDADVNSTKVDCSGRPLVYIPTFKSTSVLSFNLSMTMIEKVKNHAFAGIPNLNTLELRDNCLPGKLRTPGQSHCKIEIHREAFKNLQNLTSLILSGNSLTSIPLLPASLQVLDLQNNCIVNIFAPLNTPNLEALLLSWNCFYANPCNQSLYINETVFRKLPKLKNLTLGYDNLTAVPTWLPPSLEVLDLRENRLTEVPEGAFANLINLKYLNLEWNCQRCDHAARPCFPCPDNRPLKLHPNSLYSENSSIVFLSLRGNSLKTFPAGLFTPLKQLKGLDISDNLLAYELQNGTFFGELTALNWISLIYNYEPLKTFSKLKLSPSIGKVLHLKQLLLSGNFFQTLSEESFEVLAQLKHLNLLELRMNFISKCNLTSLKRIPSLTTVVLSQNLLNFLPCCSTSSFGIGAQDSCQNQNSYTDYFQNKPSLIIDREPVSREDVWESHNSNELEMKEDGTCRISSLWDFKHKYCFNKLTFDLSQNDILSLNQKVFLGMENVVCLDLSFNYMSQALKGGLFDSMKHLVFLNVSYNRLDLYYRDIFSELNATLKVLDVSNNDFHFKMKGMGHRFEFLQHLSNLEVLSLANNGIGMRIDHQLNSRSLKYLYFYGNNLDIMWGSDNNIYMRFFQNLTNLKYLDISDNNLKSISPEVLCNFPVSLTSLCISHNPLKYFPWRNISALSNLCHLDLSYNLLNQLVPEAIPFGDSLSSLDLSHNYITFIPENFFSEAKSLQYLFLSHNQIKEVNHQHLPVPFLNSSGLQRLTLHENPFKCDCNTSWFADFLRTTSVKIPHLMTLVRCKYPESQEGKVLLSMDQRSCQEIYGSLAFFSSSLFAVMLTVLPLLKHLYGWDVWYCLQVLWAGLKGYSQLPGSDSGHRYDAFVVFDTRNPAVRDWVYNELTVNLENSGNKRFSLCLEERDWIPGLSCIDNLHNAVHSSVKTVFVLSRGANGSETVNGMIRQTFFMVQQRLLDEKVDAAVLVLLDKMFPKLKYLQLRKRLCRKSVLSWPRNPKAQPLFWNQMRMALSSDNLKLYDNNMSESFM
ncbi:toll-like receptor 9 isoform X1 [Kryptolebias marmoratus]|uniref:toll-like receptor 9 isoform X1 n=1 Tax=Kryptolebias marmoratus TaxID=37003 RepID=UPI0007F917A0|nr:toll-like receptor 9 isoform X1 [Kryptolebias marmoratus]